jgi:hypothetical protein
MHAIEDSEASLAELEARVNRCRAAVEFSYNGHEGEQSGHGLKPEVDLLEELLEALAAVYPVTRQGELLTEIVTVSENILRVCPVDYGFRLRTMATLGNALFTMYMTNGEDESSIYRCVDVCREALALCPPGHPECGRVLHELAGALEATFDKHSDMPALIEAVAIFEESLKLRPPGHLRRSETLDGLAGALELIAQQRGDNHALDRAITLNREALELRPHGHNQRSQTLDNLASALQTQYERNGRSESLAEAIHLYRDALQLRFPGHVDYACSLDNLAGALRTRFHQDGEIEALVEAILLHREGLDESPPGHALRHVSLNNLATALLTYSREQGGAEILKEAIGLYREALLLVPKAHYLHHMYLANLAKTLSDHYRYDRDDSMLRDAITLYREALQLCPPGHMLLVHRFRALARALWDLSIEDNRPETLCEAISLLREALECHSHGHHQRCKSLETLASSLLHSYSLHGNLDQLTEAIQRCSEALETCPLEHPHRGNVLFEAGRCRLMARTESFDLTEGLELMSAALMHSALAPMLRLQLVLLNLDNLELALEHANTHAKVDAVRRHHDLQMLQLYTQAIQLLPLVASFSLTPATRLEVITGSHVLTRIATTRAFKLGLISTAVELHEEGRGVFWSQALRLSPAAFEGVAEEDRLALERVSRDLNRRDDHVEIAGSATSQGAHGLHESHRLTTEAERIISKIRSHAGLERFMMPARFEGLMRALPRGFVVILITLQTSHGTL